MRLEKTVEIDGKKVVIKELTAKDIYQAKLWFEQTETLANIVVGDYDTMMRLFKKCIDVPEGEKIEELLASANNYAKVLEAFQEVNKDFLSRLPAQMERLVIAR